MFLNQSPQEAFRASEIVAQNQAAVDRQSVLPRLLMAGAGLFLIYTLLAKGMR